MNMSIKRMIAAMMTAAMLFVFVPAAMDAECAMAASKKPAKVKITALTPTNRNLTVEWKKAKRAKKYQVYLKKPGAKWKKKKTTKSIKYEIRKLSWNKVYKIKVRALNGKKKGDFSKTAKVRMPKETTIEQIISEDKNASQILARTAKALENENMSTAISLDKNNINYDYTIKSKDPQIAAALIGNAKLMFSSDENKAGLKLIKNEIEKNAGIYGLKMNYRYLLPDGTEAFKATV